MKAEQALAELKEPELLDAVLPFWEQAMTEYRGAPSFLSTPEIRDNREYAGFPSEIDAELERTAEIVRSDKVLSRIAQYVDWRNFECEDRKGIKWPKMTPSLGDSAGVFYLLLSLAWVRRLRSYHESLGIPYDVTHETAQQTQCYALNYNMANNGKLGVFSDQYNWFHNYLGENLFFRLGRFEYWVKEFDQPHMVFRNRKTGRVTALAGPGLEVTAEGFIDGLSDGPDSDLRWTTELQVAESEAKGNPVSPRGIILKEDVVLSFSEWECVLKKGDTILDMHIPSGGRMTPDRCRESMLTARAFFRERFPDRDPAAFVCGSWMLSPLLEKILREDSNLVRFLRELYLYPVSWGGANSLWFVFFQKQFDPATAPRNTSLQRALLEYLEAGHVWHNSGMFMLLDDVDKYGSQCYRQ